MALLTKVKVKDKTAKWRASKKAQVTNKNFPRYSQKNSQKIISEKAFCWTMNCCRNIEYSYLNILCVPKNWKNEESENFICKDKSTLTALAVQRAWKLSQADKDIAMINNKNAEVTLKNIKPRNMRFPLYWQFWIWTLNFVLMPTLNFELCHCNQFHALAYHNGKFLWKFSNEFCLFYFHLSILMDRKY